MNQFRRGWVLGLFALAVLSKPALGSTPPSISPIPDQSVYPGFATGPIAFIISDAETAADALSLAGTSSDTNLIPFASVVFNGTSTNRTITITPAPSLRGAATISVTVTVGDGETNSTSFVMRVEEFTPVAAGLPLLWATGTAWGDYDRDGWLDVLTAGTVYRSSGNGTFSNAQVYFPDLSQSTVDLGDLDNDGDLDLALTASQGSFLVRPTRIFRNDNGSFAEVVASLVQIYWSTAVWGDYDNDGHADLLVTGYDTWGASNTRLYRNDGLSAFSEASTNFLQLQQSAAAWGDYDKDGRLDFVRFIREVPVWSYEGRRV